MFNNINHIKLKHIVLDIMTKSKLYSYLNYFYIAIAILWLPLQSTILTVDGKGRILLLLTIMSFIVNCNNGTFRKILFSKPIVLWLLWCIYVTINTYFRGFDDPNITFMYFTFNRVFCPCLIMAVSAYEYVKSPSTFLKRTLLIYLVYTFIGTFVMDIGYVASEEGATSANTLGNALALNVVMIIFFAGMLYCHKRLTLTWTAMLIMLAIGIVVLSATRKALGAGAIMVIALILSQIKLTFSSFLKLILPIIILYYGFGFIMDNTKMGERFSELEEQTDKVSTQYDVENNTFLKVMGDRAPQYILGTQIFVEHPITGVGLNNFRRESGYPFVLHTEYMVQLCECGLIGCILFIAFYISIIRQLLRRVPLGEDNKKIAIMALGTIAAFLFIYLTAWSYSFCTYFVILGCIVGYIYNGKLKKII